jgi:hypothetical protein
MISPSTCSTPRDKPRDRKPVAGLVVRETGRVASGVERVTGGAGRVTGGGGWRAGRGEFLVAAREGVMDETVIFA